MVKELEMTRKTASSYLNQLEEIGVLETIKMGREVYFVNVELFKLLQKSIISFKSKNLAKYFMDNNPYSETKRVVMDVLL